ncbi:MAG: D-aminoacyl-tRNA deacylase [Anaerolineales bacterium]|nr:D-aminoacyl-tRNA deacylase [Anaerolineales bacterium]
MKAVIQRVSKGSVSVGGNKLSTIQRGMVILLGVGPEDNKEHAEKLAQKISNLRIFEDEQGKMNLSLVDIDGEALVVPQFTLYADTRRGHRPSFTDAAPPAIAEPLVDYFVSCLEELGISAPMGEFGAHMLVEIHNDGPVTILIEV